MSCWELGSLLLFIALVSPGLSLARHPFPADPIHKSALDYPCDCSTEGDSDESVVSELPPNVSAPEGLKRTLDLMLMRSPTFRHQCKLLHDAGNVRIDLMIFVSRASLYKAMSLVQRFEDGSVLIQMRFAAPGDYIEVIGHEFEHALEQAEGLDLRALASARGCKVYEIERGVFETARAVHAGRIVAQEYYSRRRSHLRRCDCNSERVGEKWKLPRTVQLFGTVGRPRAYFPACN